MNFILGGSISSVAEPQAPCTLASSGTLATSTARCSSNPESGKSASEEIQEKLEKGAHGGGPWRGQAASKTRKTNPGKKKFSPIRSLRCSDPPGVQICMLWGPRLAPIGPQCPAERAESACLEGGPALYTGADLSFTRGRLHSFVADEIHPPQMKTIHGGLIFEICLWRELALEFIHGG